MQDKQAPQSSPSPSPSPFPLPKSTRLGTKWAGSHLTKEKQLSLVLQEAQESKVTELDLSGILTPLPSEIGLLSSLQKLDLSNNLLSVLPPEIGQLKNLTTLNLAGNLLLELPPEIKQLGLTYLDLRGNRLGIPEEILLRFDEPQTIIKYHFYHEIEAIKEEEEPQRVTLPERVSPPPATSQHLPRVLLIQPSPFPLPTTARLLHLYKAYHLTKKERLSIVISQAISKAIKGHMTELDFSRLLVPLSPEIGLLSDLERLDLSHNLLNTLPPEIGKLLKLQALNLSGNLLTSLPSPLCNLRHLRVLLLKRSGIGPSLLKELCCLTNLTQLDLSFNRLSYLPPQIGQLAKLTTLDLKFNQLKNLPLQLGKLTELIELDLSFNRLSYLPTEISQLTHLSKLDLSRNRLTSLPPEIGKLKKLTVLDLRFNQLTHIPIEVRQLKNLTHLDLRHNPLQQPLNELLFRGQQR